MDFRYSLIDRWPPLAWLAVCRPDSPYVDIAHGGRVETGPDWFAEAVWDADYERGDFDRTDLVYGTGGRIRDNGIIFVSSATAVERLHSLESDGQVWISNSLACLLEAADANISPDYSGYFEDFESIIRGIEDYCHLMATSAGPVQLTYYRNLLWCNNHLSEIPKPNRQHDFSSFRRYRVFLENSLSKIADNMRSDLRAYPYEMLATISSGYDSPTVATVARRAGLEETLSFSSSRDGRPDSGEEIARRLDLEPLVVDSTVWRDEPYSEVPFVASDAKGEDVYYHGATDLLEGRVLLTGYGGSRVWNKGQPKPVNFERSDQSGLSLCEFRLWSGFLHCPVTFMGGRQTGDLCQISNLPEMQPWDIPGDYSRPICRRILEEAGIPRTMFGVEKKAASILLFDRNSFLSPASLTDYQRWLKRNGRLSDATATRRAADTIRASARRAVRVLQRSAAVLHTFVPIKLIERVSTSGRLTRFANHEPLFTHVFPWAIERAKLRYAYSHLFDRSAACEEEYALSRD